MSIVRNGLAHTLTYLGLALFCLALLDRIFALRDFVPEYWELPTLVKWPAGYLIDVALLLIGLGIVVVGAKITPKDVGGGK
jgi:hypothetical protein